MIRFLALITTFVAVVCGNDGRYLILKFWKMCNEIVSIADVCTLKSLEAGLCVNALRCPAALAEIKLNKHPPLCRYEGKEPIICCAKGDVISDVGDISRKSKFFLYL